MGVSAEKTIPDNHAINYDVVKGKDNSKDRTVLFPHSFSTLNVL